MARTGNITISFLTVYGTKMADILISAPSTGMLFSSPILSTDIERYQTVINIPPVKLNFTAANGIIEASETIIPVSPAILSFIPSDLKIGITIQVNSPVAELVFTCPTHTITANKVNLLHPPGVMQFNSTNVSIEGSEIILSPETPSIIFSVSTNITLETFFCQELYLIQEDSAPLLIFDQPALTPTEITAYKTIIPVTGTLIFDQLTPWIHQPDVDLGTTLPFFTVRCDAQSSANHDSLDITIPSMSLILWSGGVIQEEFPDILMDGVLFPGKTASLQYLLPSLVFQGKMGGGIQGDLSSLFFTANTISTVPADFNGKIPFFMFSGNIVLMPLGNLSAFLPIIQSNIMTIGGGVGDFTGSIEHFIMRATGLYGGIANFQNIFPNMQFKASSIITGDNDIKSMIPMMYIKLQSDSLDSEIFRYLKSEILRYVKGRIR